MITDDLGDLRIGKTRILSDNGSLVVLAVEDESWKRKDQSIDISIMDVSISCKETSGCDPEFGSDVSGTYRFLDVGLLDLAGKGKWSWVILLARSRYLYV